MKKLVLFVIVALVSVSVFAQKGKKTQTIVGANLRFEITGAQDTMTYLVFHFRDKLMLKDSARATKSGVFIFKSETPYQEGLYMIVSQNKKPYLNFIMTAKQDFTMKCDTANDPMKIKVEGSPENDEMLRFEQKGTESRKLMTELKEQQANYEKKNNKKKADECKAQIKALDSVMTAFIWELIERNPDYLFSKLQKAYQQIEIPEPPVRQDGTIDSNFKFNYYLNHYFDNIDMTDSRLLYTPVIEPKLKEYFTKTLYYQPSDTICKYVDKALDMARPDSVFFRFMLEWITYRFESSKVIGHDAVFVHIAKENQLKGKATWLDEDMIKKYEKRVKNLEPVLIGKIAPEIIMPDTTQTDDYRRWYSSYRMTKPYVILWFYDPDCPTCNKETSKLKQVYDSLETAGVRNFDVYGVSADEDIARWKRYLKEKQVKWINVGGMKANIDYMHAYNIYESGTPSMIIFDNETKEIILNRRIEMSNIEEFLKQYEKKFKNKKQ
ncbi:MAG: DUF5106 domain-containing protein [Bacteroidales bacterium]|nr:DUF5106 domain-containing protein [Bacteroidales bacterium]